MRTDLRDFCYATMHVNTNHTGKFAALRVTYIHPLAT